MSAGGDVARVEAEAKVNLFLRVLEREASGYHQIVTLFQRIALADTVTVRTRGTRRALTCSGADAGPLETNLAWLAANAFATAAGWPDGFDIEIHKRIPVGGGLGGGSADAAGVLRALNALAPRPLDGRSMASIAFGLGADVPYLLSDRSLAIGSGRGERLVGLEPLPRRNVLLLVPPFGVSSRDAFAWTDARRGAASPASPPSRPPLVLPDPLSWFIVEGHAANDLEAAVFARHPELAALCGALERSGARIARMTGSGSTLFGIHDVAPRDVDLGPGVDLRSFAVRLVETTTLEQVASVELG